MGELWNWFVGDIKLTAIKFPSCRCPAILAASLATPSIKQPSPVNTVYIRYIRWGPRSIVGLTVSIVVHDIKVILVIDSREMGLSDGETYGICEALAKRAGSYLDT